MTKSIQGIINSKLFGKLRKVREPLYFLSASRKKKLRGSSIMDFFDIDFLRRIGLGRDDTSLLHLSRTVRQILLLLEYKTVGDLEKHCNPYLLAQFSGIGVASLAFLLDLMTALDLSFKKMDLKPDYGEGKTNGKALADSMGLPG
jgi:hypothetical protein